MVDNQENGWVLCEKCGKRLLRRKPNGVFSFKFGKRKDESGLPVVDMEIVGSIRVKCWGNISDGKGKCDHVNIINFFPPNLTVKRAGKEQIIKEE